MMKLLYFSIPSFFILWGLWGLYKKSQNTKYIVILSFGLSIIAFYTMPNISDDLQRHFTVINEFKNAPLEAIFYSGYTPNYLNNFIMFLVSKTGIPNLYTMFFTFLGYFILFKYIDDIYQDNNINSKSQFLLLILFAFSLSFYKVYILAIRNYFCFIAGIYILYLYQKNKINIYLYSFFLLLLSLIHVVSLIFIAYFIFIKLKNKYVKISVLILILFHKLLLTIFLNLIPHNNYFYEKLMPYLTEEIQAYNINFMILYGIIILFSLFLVYLTYTTNQEKSQLLLFSTIFALSTYYQFDLIRRFIYVVPIIMCDSLSLVIKNDVKLFNLSTKKISYFFMIGLIIGSLITIYTNTRAYGWYLIF
ncbi:hypothetical protein [Traorella massiliensis]|uniref:hypothetical protein n=1 Tax=Traorella massiliensis TaxID=1903263 RepID=UPI002356567C|nr:hypothetical protein [Traorella massiliensis]